MTQVLLSPGKVFVPFLMATLLSVSTVAEAGRGHSALPALGGKSPGLTMKVLRYTGGTNGKMEVEVRNPGAQAVVFDPQGLYFVPQGDPENAPQRLGAAGPFEVSMGGQWRPQEKLRVAPGRSVKVQLQVFCIDSHRSSPSALHQFAMAKERLPKNLRQKIVTGTQEELRKSGGRMPAAKSAIQSRIWRSRDTKWIKLEGERRQEKSPPGQDQLHQRQQPAPRQLRRPIQAPRRSVD